MKKKIIVGITLLASLFIIFICGALGIGLFIGNSYGINISDDSLFQTVEITTLSREQFPQGDYKQFIDNDLAQKTDIVINNDTDQPLDVNLYVDTVDGKVKYNCLYGSASSNLYIEQLNTNTYSIKSIPDEYDYYLLYTNEFNANAESNVTFHFSYEDENNNQSQDFDTITIKQGDSYEIKLP